MTKLCPACRTVFETPYPDHVYCTDTCQRREKGRRRKARRLAHKATEAAAFHDDRFHATVANPTAQQLTEILVDVAEGKFDKPVLVIGFLPKDYLKPNNVDIVEQVKEANEPDKWLIVKREPSVMDILGLSPQ